MDAEKAKRQSWADAPRVFITLPACPECNSTNLHTIRSEANGDGSRTRYTICRACQKKFFVVPEPIPEFGKEGEGVG